MKFVHDENCDRLLVKRQYDYGNDARHFSELMYFDAARRNTSMLILNFTMCHTTAVQFVPACIQRWYKFHKL